MDSIRVISVYMSTVALLAGCSSNSSQRPSGGGSNDAGGTTSADAAGSVDGSSAVLADASAPLSADAAGGGLDSTAPDAMVDVAQSPECAAYCAKASQCGTCDPAVDCAPPQGSCPQAQLPYLQ